MSSVAATLGVKVHASPAWTGSIAPYWRCCAAQVMVDLEPRTPAQRRPGSARREPAARYARRHSRQGAGPARPHPSARARLRQDHWCRPAVLGSGSHHGLDLLRRQRRGGHVLDADQRLGRQARVDAALAGVQVGHRLLQRALLGVARVSDVVVQGPAEAVLAFWWKASRGQQQPDRRPAAHDGCLADGHG